MKEWLVHLVGAVEEKRYIVLEIFEARRRGEARDQAMLLLKERVASGGHRRFELVADDVVDLKLWLKDGCHEDPENR